MQLNRQQRSLPLSMHGAALCQPAVQLQNNDPIPQFVRHSGPLLHLWTSHLAAWWQKQRQAVCSQQQSLPGLSRPVAYQRIRDA